MDGRKSHLNIDRETWSLSLQYVLHMWDKLSTACERADRNEWQCDLFHVGCLRFLHSCVDERLWHGKWRKRCCDVKFCFSKSYICLKANLLSKLDTWSFYLPTGINRPVARAMSRHSSTYESTTHKRHVTDIVTTSFVTRNIHRSFIVSADPPLSVYAH